ncbi:MAG: substrate-binding domain-containing protein [Xanthobacteraceae bacterium]|nr:substrate-binding domain-containing protein [Xanthobacteraceae bacterium]
MGRISFAACAAILSFTALLFSSLAQAAEIKVLASVALTAALNELAPQYERATGNKLSLGYSLVADIRKRVLEGETADVIILSRPVMDELQKQQKLAAGSIADVAGIAVAVTARAGAPKPDISSPDALKRSLLAAKSVVYADPAKGGLSGVYFARVLERLGIADEMKPKTILVPGDQSAEVVAKGEAEIGVAQTSEIIPVAGAQLVGPLPGDLNLVTVFSAGLGAGAKAADAATSYVKFITGPSAAPVLRARGMDPR